jgi:hypothetical protein
MASGVATLEMPAGYLMRLGKATVLELLLEALVAEHGGKCARRCRASPRDEAVHVAMQRHADPARHAILEVNAARLYRFDGY